MAWEDDLFALFDDLEGQAEALYDLEREAELADRGRIEYAQVSLGSRLMASLDTELGIEVRGVGRLSGRLARVGTGWCLLAAAGVEWIIRYDGIGAVHQPSLRSIPEVAWSVGHRLGFASACRRLADAGAPALVHLMDGTRHEGRAERVGGDFLEVRSPAGALGLVPFSAIAAISSAPGAAH